MSSPNLNAASILRNQDEISGSNPGEDERFRSETLGEAYNVTPNESTLENYLKSRVTEGATLTS